MTHVALAIQARDRAGHLPITLRHRVARASAVRRSKAQAAPSVILITTKLGDEHRGIGHRLQQFWF